MKIRSIIRPYIPKRILKLHRRKFLARSLKRQEASRNLRRKLLSEKLTLSQAGQDLWVYGNVFNEKKGGYFVDLGAYDGVHISNTFILESRYGWGGLLIEANPQTFSELQQNRTATCLNACVSATRESVLFRCNHVLGGIVSHDCDDLTERPDERVIKIESVPLESILRDAKAPNIIDYLSVDIEGAEDLALLEFPFHLYQFTAITIERPSHELREVLKRNKYLLVAEIPGLDCFYIHESHAGEYHNNTMLFWTKSKSITFNKLDDIQ
jgi:FkbM family methyltransferase